MKSCINCKHFGLGLFLNPVCCINGDNDEVAIPLNDTTGCDEFDDRVEESL